MHKSKTLQAAAANAKKENTFRIMMRLVKELNTTPAVLIISLIFGILGSLIWSFASLALGPMVQVIFQPNTTEVDGLGLVNLFKDVPVVGLIVIMGVCYVLYSVMMLIQNVIMIKISQASCTRLRWQTYCRLQKMPISYFDTNSSGDLMSRLTNDIDNISQALTQASAQFIQGITTVLFMFVILMVLSPYLTLITIVVLIILSAIGVFFVMRAQPKFIDQQVKLGELNGYIEEIFSGHKVISLLNQQDEAIKNFKGFNEAMVPSAVSSQTLSVLIFPWFNFVTNLTFLIFIVFAAIFMNNKIPSGGTGDITDLSFVISFSTLLRGLTNPINQWLSIFNLVQAGIAGASRVFVILDLQTPPENPNARDLREVKGHVEFKNVNFGYTADKLNLVDANIDAKPGQVIAIVGPTGAGKTTIINLLTKFYNYNDGKIEIDGNEITDINDTSWRNNISIVLQDTYLFTTTIKENIRYGNLNATDEEVIAAAKVADAHDFIMKLENGYDSVVESNGRNFSQGQRQLLAIARAVIRNAPILLLDEATSSVDTRTEVQIQQAMLRLMKGKTSFVIAHRLSTIKNADQILVVSDGKIIEKGNHNELLALNGFYANLYNSQFKKGISGDVDTE